MPHKHKKEWDQFTPTESSLYGIEKALKSANKLANDQPAVSVTAVALAVFPTMIDLSDEDRDYYDIAEEALEAGEEFMKAWVARRERKEQGRIHDNAESN